MNPNKTTHSKLTIGLLLSVGLVIIFLSCNDGTFYTELCKKIVAPLDFADPKITLSFLDQPSVGHALFYALLTFLLLQTVNVFISIIIALSFGGLLEIFQIFLPTRQALLNDFLADVVGIIFAAFFYQFIVWSKTNTLKTDEE